MKKYLRYVFGFGILFFTVLFGYLWSLHTSSEPTQKELSLESTLSNIIPSNLSSVNLDVTFEESGTIDLTQLANMMGSSVTVGNNSPTDISYVTSSNIIVNETTSIYDGYSKTNIVYKDFVVSDGEEVEQDYYGDLTNQLKYEYVNDQWMKTDGALPFNLMTLQTYPINSDMFENLSFEKQKDKTVVNGQMAFSALRNLLYTSNIYYSLFGTIENDSTIPFTMYLDNETGYLTDLKFYLDKSNAKQLLAQTDAQTTENVSLSLDIHINAWNENDTDSIPKKIKESATYQDLSDEHEHEEE